MEYRDDIGYAKQLDATDPLRKYRDAFFIPERNGEPVLYFCGNSLGLQPKRVHNAIQQELDDWQKLGVAGHFKAHNPWFYYHHFFSEPASRLVGAKPEEVVVMNTLTTNLHLLMVSFYRPTHRRYKILIEKGAFPSDHYAVESQVRFHGYDPDSAIIEIAPREGEQILRTEDICAAIEQHQESLALVVPAGVNYYTGQVLDMARITRTAHAAGALAGFDLAHAAGNIPLELHDWEVDFAVWCTYKYLNSGPGGPGGAFVHEKHGQNPELPRFAGWWGHDEETRFKMEAGFKPQPGASGWQLSNAPVLGMAAHKAALDMFDEVGMPQLRAKSEKLTGYLIWLTDRLAAKYPQLQRITPGEPEAHGCQVSFVIKEKGKAVHQKLTEAGVMLDWREPEVLRLAPVPFYNTFEEVHHFTQLLIDCLET